MNKLLNIGILTICLAIGSCGTTKNNTEKAVHGKRPFDIISATYSSSVTDSTNIKKIDIFIEIDSPEIQLDSIYFKNTPIRLSREINSSKPVFIGNFFLSNTPKNYYLHSDAKKEYGNTPSERTSKIPFDLQKNEAVISYLFKGKRQYFNISNLIEIEPNYN